MTIWDDVLRQQREKEYPEEAWQKARKVGLFMVAIGFLLVPVSVWLWAVSVSSRIVIATLVTSMLLTFWGGSVFKADNER